MRKAHDGRAAGQLRPGARAALYAVCAGVLTLPACKGILESNNSDAVTGSQLEGPAVIAAVINGVMAKFATAYDFIILETALASDEMRLVPNSPWIMYDIVDTAGIFPLLPFPGQNLGNLTEPHWANLQETRWLAEEAYRRIASAGPVTTDSSAANARLYSGIANLFLGELSCDVAFDLGPAQPPVTALNRAETHLTEAITIADAATRPRTSQLAHLMRARARMALGNTTGALADAQAVPAGFLWTSRPTLTGVASWFYSRHITFVTMTTDPAFRTTGDPRVVVVSRNGGTLGTLYDARKYAAPGDGPQRLGTWQEARLIEAEIQNEAGNTTAAITALNLVRTGAGLAATTAVTQAQVRAAVRQERRYELFLEGRRFQDMQRFGETPTNFIGKYDRPPESYGPIPFNKVCIQIPLSERDQNPNLGPVRAFRP